jgi:integrase
MGAVDIVGWLEELRVFENLIRREFHLLLLLSGSRPTALKRARIDHIDFRSRLLHIPRPKGGEDRAFDIPLSGAMIRRQRLLQQPARSIRKIGPIYPSGGMTFVRAIARSLSLQEYRSSTFTC